VGFGAVSDGESGRVRSMRSPFVCALEHWNNEKGCMVNVSQGNDVFGSNLGYNRLILVNACWGWLSRWLVAGIESVGGALGS
jgi:hypothetical protein